MVFIYVFNVLFYVLFVYKCVLTTATGLQHNDS